MALLETRGLTARYGEFGPFFINLRLTSTALWQHLHL